MIYFNFSVFMLSSVFIVLMNIKFERMFKVLFFWKVGLINYILMEIDLNCNEFFFYGLKYGDFDIFFF